MEEKFDCYLEEKNKFQIYLHRLFTTYKINQKFTIYMAKLRTFIARQTSYISIRRKWLKIDSEGSNFMKYL